MNTVSKLVGALLIVISILPTAKAVFWRIKLLIYTGSSIIILVRTTNVTMDPAGHSGVKDIISEAVVRAEESTVERRY